MEREKEREIGERNLSQCTTLETICVTGDIDRRTNVAQLNESRLTFGPHSALSPRLNPTHVVPLSSTIRK
ncbi:unnamed protein product [Nippostrongylus brasiliensis]|uniref:Uncharacterized protein n=1 Tax=Nippostrongylus brasiliensis TaxID=27835 RepID=A0A0N4Y644_NIPBR|nr:unnamed protein product [Nippostrongylus brasiliensis]